MSDVIRVLIVDDSEDDRELCRRALSRITETRYNIDEIDDGDRAIVRVARSTPDCVLIDYSLPGRNGLEVLKLIRANHPFVPILMLTGQGSETIAVSAMQQGAQNYISKATIDSEKIHLAIQVAIAHCEMQRRLHEQRLSLEIFTRALAHDLKEPVRTIRSFMGVLTASETLSEQGRSYFGFVQTAADRMAALIEAVYDYTRLDASAQQAAREDVNVEDVFQSVIADLHGLINERGAQVSAGALPIIHAEGSRVRQVLQNLISNAIHHGPETPVIRVEAEDHGRQWRFNVIDNGAGVEEEVRRKIFDPFSRQSKHNGLGMGLAICKRIVESHGGRIWCEAGAKGGAVFTFVLPKRPIGKREPQTESNDAPTPSLGASDEANLATILVVDDNEAAIELARIMLVEQSKLRCRILSVGSGEEAINLLNSLDERARVDLILLDINMPRMDGFEVLARLGKLANRFRPPVIMCSTSSYDKDKERARALGACGYLEKPPQLRYLQPILNSIDSLRLEQLGNSKALLRVA